MRHALTALTALAAATGLAAPAPARAQDAPAAPFAITGNAALVSDYRFRGLSLSNKDIALQGAIRVDHTSGFYLATWASSIEQLAGSEVEVDVYGGWAGNFNGWKPDVGLYSYLYPGGDGLNYFELFGSLTRQLGPVSATVGVNYAPDQGNIVQDNIYVYGKAGLGIPNTPFALQAGLGFEDGAFGDNKLDWQLGATATFGRLSFGLSYIDTDQDFRIGRAGLVASVTAAF